MGDYGLESISVRDTTRLGGTIPGPAVGDGMRDDTPSIIAALTVLAAATAPSPFPTQGYLYFPPGRYRIAPVPYQPQPGVVLTPRTPFPPQRGLNFSVDIVFPSNVTLWFAPGAVLFLDNANIEIWGAIRAGLHQIFTTGTETSSGGVVVLGFDPTGSTFGFTSPFLPTPPAIPAVYPEWWGARSTALHDLIGRDDTAAVQAAIDAAYSNRTRASLGPLPPQISAQPQVLLPPIPVVLTGRYVIHRTLNIGILRATSFNNPQTLGWHPNGIIVRGSASATGDAGATPTLACEPPSQLASILDIIGAPGSIFENVAFDGAGRARACVRVWSDNAPGAPATAQAVTFRDCAFRGATHRLVHLGAELPDAIRHQSGAATAQPLDGTANTPTPVLMPGNMDLSNTAFAGCLFHATRPPTPNVVIQTQGTAGGPVVVPIAANGGTSPYVVGVELRASASLGIRFSGCRFTGEAAAMLLVWGGNFLLENCAFANTYAPQRRPGDRVIAAGGNSPVAIPGGTFEPFRLAGSPLDFPDGSDVYLALPPPEDGGSAGSILRTMGSFTAVNCDSTSASFLASWPHPYVLEGPQFATPTHRTADPQTLVRVTPQPMLTPPSTLVNVRHGPQRSAVAGVPLVSPTNVRVDPPVGGRSPQVIAPSVSWGPNGRLTIAVSRDGRTDRPRDGQANRTSSDAERSSRERAERVARGRPSSSRVT